VFKALSNDEITSHKMVSVSCLQKGLKDNWNRIWQQSRQVLLELLQSK
jgi:hypothetical protein